jgi:hypothetical protein
MKKGWTVFVLNSPAIIILVEKVYQKYNDAAAQIKELNEYSFSWQHDYQDEDEDDDLKNPGDCWNYMAKDNTDTFSFIGVPTVFDLQKIVDRETLLNKMGLGSCLRIIFDSKSESKNIPSKAVISDQGRWLSDASRYSKNSDGTTGGPSGLKFL